MQRIQKIEVKKAWREWIYRKELAKIPIYIWRCLEHVGIDFLINENQFQFFL